MRIQLHAASLFAPFRISRARVWKRLTLRGPIAHPIFLTLPATGWPRIAPGPDEAWPSLSGGGLMLLSRCLTLTPPPPHLLTSEHSRPHHTVPQWTGRRNSPTSTRPRNMLPSSFTTLSRVCPSGMRRGDSGTNRDHHGLFLRRPSGRGLSRELCVWKA